MARDDANNVDDLYRIIVEELPERIILTGAARPREQNIHNDAEDLMNIVLGTLDKDRPNDIELAQNQDPRLWNKLIEASVTAAQNNRFRDGPIITRNDP